RDRLSRVEAGMSAGHHRYYIGELDGQPIATIRVSGDQGRVDVTSFAVLPELQGRGLGRQVLTRTVRRLAAEGRAPILIEVQTDNRGALGLYQSCGFEERQTFFYYAVGV